ncbi:hypothetical protein HDU97_003669 [Phlyctochytrium planicorne]|nr:hypothetical protein HDU97_003669 [Phlyctochytrium planicorne]
MRRHHPALQSLCNAGADPNALEDVLSDATACSTDTKTIKLLFSLGVDPRQPSSSMALFDATDKPLLLKYLIDSGVSVTHAVRGDQRKESVLAIACIHGHMDAIHILLDAGANMHYGKNMALSKAISNYRLDVVQCLIDRAVNVNAPCADGDKHVSPLVLSSRIRDTRVFFLLVNAGADYRPHADEILHAAAANRHLDIVRWMMEHGASLDQGDMSESILVACVKRGEWDMLRFCVDAGARFVSKSRVSTAALAEMARLGHVEWAKALKKQRWKVPLDVSK